MSMSKYVPYHAESVAYAKKITKDAKSDMEKYRIIIEFIKKNFAYDYVRAITIPKVNGLPDLNRTWKSRLGICLDVASLTTGMLRAVGLEAVLCFGYTEKAYHAWVETRIEGKNYRFDWSGTAKKYEVKKRFT